MKPHGVSSKLLLLFLAFPGFSCDSLTLRGSREPHAREVDSNGGGEALASTPLRHAGRTNGSFFEDISSTLDSVSRVIDKVQDVRGAVRGPRKRPARAERSASGRPARDDATGGGDERPGARNDDPRVGDGSSGAAGVEGSQAPGNDEGEE